MGKEPNQIVDMIEAFNANAAIWGSVLNLHKTRILCNKSLKGISQWMTDLEIEQDQHSVGKYLGIWLSIKNSTCNVHYDKILAKAQRTLYFLKSKGLGKKCTPFTEAVAIIKALIFPQLLFAAEVLCPSEAVIKKVDKFILHTLSTFTHIPIDALPITARWEANVDSFETMLMRAKLNFHYKLSQSKYPSQARKIYTCNNYLRKHNSLILNKLQLDTYTPEEIGRLSAKGELSKYTWKELCNKKLQSLTSPLDMGPFGNIKTEREACTWLDREPQGQFKTLMRFRHNTIGRKWCPCQPTAVENVPWHLAFDCGLTGNVLGRVPLMMLLHDCIVGSNELSKVEMLQYLLGKNIPQIKHGRRGDALTEAAARYFHESMKHMAEEGP
jgi:hypothetical protein